MDDVDLFGRAGEVRVNLSARDVADDQQRGILKRIAVLTELAIGVFEVLIFVLAFVLPAELATPPRVD